MGKKDDREMLRSGYMLQRTSRAFYQNIPASNGNYWSFTRYELIPFPFANGTLLVGQQDVPEQMTLDLTSVVFKILLAGPDDTFIQAGDYYGFERIVFDMTVNNRHVLDQTIALTSANVTRSQIQVTNQNIFTADDDIPFHLVVNERQTIRFNATTTAGGGGFSPPNGSYVLVEANGRWIPKGVWDDMAEDLR